jgi:hypothetical protein
MMASDSFEARSCAGSNRQGQAGFTHSLDVSVILAPGIAKSGNTIAAYAVETTVDGNTLGL